MATPNTNPILTNNNALNLDEATTGTIVSARLRIVDPDITDIITYTLTSLPSNGSLKLNGVELNLTTNKTFTQADIDNNRLTYTHNGTKTTNDSFNFTATDGFEGNINTSTFNIAINPFNYFPEDIKLSNTNIAENSIAGTVIADLSTVDRNIQDTHTYKLFDSVGGRFTIEGSQLKIGDASLFNFENGNNTHEIVIQSTDNGNPSLPSAWKKFTINITDANEAPTVTQGIASQTVNAHTAFNYQVAANTFTDVDAGDSFSYRATLADGSPLPAWLKFDATTRTFTGTPADGDAGNINISVIATDKGGLTNNTRFNLTINSNNVAPTDITLSSSTVVENTPDSVVLANISTIDANASDSHTYTLLNDADGRFKIEGNQLKVANAALVDFETNTSHVIRIRTTDKGGQILEKDLTINVTNLNEAPIVSQPVAAQSINANTAFRYQLAANIFTDVDAGDSITYRATLANGQALPAWLTFDASTRTFSGTPTNANAGLLNIVITATDRGGLTNTTPFNLSVNRLNSAPKDINISNSNVAENSANGLVIANLASLDSDASDIHNYTLVNNAEGRFTIEGNQLKVLNGSLLNFESATNHTIRVRSTDNGGQIFEKDLIIGVTNVNEAPTVVQAIAAQTITANQALNYQVSANTFADFDAGDALSYRASLANGQPLPAWLRFDANTCTFSGTPVNTGAGNLNLLITATDRGGLTTNTPFNLTVNRVNTPPKLNKPSFRQGVNWTNSAERNTGKFTLAEDTFIDADAGDQLTYSVKQVHGFSWNWQNVSGVGSTPVLLSATQKTALPQPIKFDPATRTFTIDPSLRGDIWIEVVATDKAGATASDLFHIYNYGSGVGIDNYISGGTAFFDANKNGLLDANEPFAITNEKGEFSINLDVNTFDTNKNGILDPSEGRTVLTGGIDVATGLQLETPITATPDSYTVTMLTSLLADLVDRGISRDVAETQLTNALSLPANFPITYIDPIAATNNNDAGGSKVFAEMIKTQNTATQIAALLDGASSASLSQLTKAAIAAISSYIATGSKLDLTSPETLTKIIQDAATNAKQIDPKIVSQSVINVAQKAALIMAESNQSIDEAVAKNTGTNITAEVARAQLMTLGEVTKDLFEVTAGIKNITQAVAENTGLALDNQILAVTPKGETLTGTNSNDNLTGKQGSDSLNGGAGNDILTGNASFDTLTGGTGNDQFVIRLGDGSDIISDFSGLGKGNQPTAAVIAAADTLKFEGAGLTAQNMVAYQKDKNLVLTFENVSGPRVTLQNFGLENLDNLTKPTGGNVNFANILFDGDTVVKDSFDVIDSGQQLARVYRTNVTTFLNDLNNKTTGFNNSNDVINGQGGNDSLTGLSGNDILRGGDGDDLLDGGVGKDMLTGGVGKDTFILIKCPSGGDIINDFEDGIDLLRLGSGLKASQLSITENNEGTLISAGGQLLATLKGIDSTLINAQDFALV